MSGNPKFLIAERFGNEIEFKEEYVPESEDVLFEFGSALTVKDKLLFPNNNLMPRLILEDLIIPENFILTLHEPTFEKNIILDGDLVVL